MTVTSGHGGEVAGLVGCSFDDAPLPHTWEFSVPVFFGVRYAERPANWPTDSHSETEDMAMLIAGARAVWTRTWTENAIELGLGMSVSIPIARSEQSKHSYYQDPPTFLWLDASIFIGWTFGI